EVSPAATAHGKVVDREGNPLSNETILCWVRVALRDQTPVTFQFETRTDIGGAFRVRGLLPGSACEVTVLRGDAPVAMRVPFRVREAGEVGLPDLVLQELGP